MGWMTSQICQCINPNGYSITPETSFYFARNPIRPNAATDDSSSSSNFKVGYSLD